jgi:uncharacterized membrane protein YphA (DoxX/SURF4 family)
MLQRLFSTYPDQWTGVGLVVIRTALAAYCVGAGINAFTSPSTYLLPGRITGILDLVAAVLLLAGFLMPIASALCMAGTSLEVIALLPASAPAPPNHLAPLYVLLMISAALVLLGPGAFSVDAHLFGRREIIIPQRPYSSSQTPLK